MNASKERHKLSNTVITLKLNNETHWEISSCCTYYVIIASKQGSRQPCPLWAVASNASLLHHATAASPPY